MFTGIPREAVDFYAELEHNNNREWWLANKARHDELVKQPFEALAAEVGPAFGETKVYRPYRDVRFSHDKTPYKTHQGLFAKATAHGGWYLHLDANGISLGGGTWWLAPEQLQRFRAAVADLPGVQLEAVLRELTDAGYTVGGDQLATRPRGVPADAPRLDLLRRKAISVQLALGTPEWMSTPEMAEYLRDGWDEVRPLNEWIHDFVGESEGGRR